MARKKEVKWYSHHITSHQGYSLSTRLITDDVNLDYIVKVSFAVFLPCHSLSTSLLAVFLQIHYLSPIPTSIPYLWKQVAKFSSYSGVGGEEEGLHCFWFIQPTNSFEPLLCADILLLLWEQDSEHNFVPSLGLPSRVEASWLAIRKSVWEGTGLPWRW